jgi:hypothetical protein
VEICHEAKDTSFYLARARPGAQEADTIYTALAIGDPIRNEPLVLTSKQR